MKVTRVLIFSGVAALAVASRLLFVSPAIAAPVPSSAAKVEKVPGPDFQPPAYFANQRAAYQAAKATHPEKYAPTNAKEPEWFFTGKPYDADSKSYFFKYRNYRSDTASWMTPDPAGFPDGPNNYAYAPVPTSQFDLMGLLDWVSSYTNTDGNYTIPGATYDEDTRMYNVPNFNNVATNAKFTVWDIGFNNTNAGLTHIMCFEGADSISSNAYDLRYDCHGLTFANDDPNGGRWWIQDFEVTGSFMAAEGYSNESHAHPKNARVVTFGGAPYAHSAIVTSPNDDWNSYMLDTKDGIQIEDTESLSTLISTYGTPTFWE